MSSKDPLILPIEGYRIALVKEGEEFNTHIKDFPLRLSKVGGAHIKNPEDLIMLIEDTVYKQEQKDAKHSS
jgi:hypothetical protein